MNTPVTETVREALEKAERAMHSLVKSADLIAEADPHAVQKFLRDVGDGLHEFVDALEEEPHLKIVKQ